MRGPVAIPVADRVIASEVGVRGSTLGQGLARHDVVASVPRGV